MENHRPMPVEPLEYRMVVEDAWPRIIRVLAIVGLLVGISRVANGVLYLWITGIVGKSPYGAGMLVSPLSMLRVLPVFLSGPTLLAASCGMLMNQRWGMQLAIVSECISIAAFPILLIVIPLDMRGNPPAITIYQTCSALVSVMGSLAFPILLILMLRIYKTTAPSAR